jgi:hypothetical protein
MTMKVVVKEELPEEVQDYLIIGAIDNLKNQQLYADGKSILETANRMYGNRISFSEKQIEISLGRLEESKKVKVTTNKEKKVYQTDLL